MGFDSTYFTLQPRRKQTTLFASAQRQKNPRRWLPPCLTPSSPRLPLPVPLSTMTASPSHHQPTRDQTQKLEPPPLAKKATPPPPPPPSLLQPTPTHQPASDLTQQGHTAATTNKPSPRSLPRFLFDETPLSHSPARPGSSGVPFIGGCDCGGDRHHVCRTRDNLHQDL